MQVTQLELAMIHLLPAQGRKRRGQLGWSIANRNDLRISAVHPLGDLLCCFHDSYTLPVQKTVRWLCAHTEAVEFTRCSSFAYWQRLTAPPVESHEASTGSSSHGAVSGWLSVGLVLRELSQPMVLTRSWCSREGKTMESILSSSPSQSLGSHRI